MVALVLGLLAVFVGYLWGASATYDLCSSPACRAPLSKSAKDCRVCRGTIAGVIRASNEHYSEAAEVRRELAALRAEEAKALKTGKKKKGKKKKSEPKAGPDNS